MYIYEIYKLYIGNSCYICMSVYININICIYVCVPTHAQIKITG